MKMPTRKEQLYNTMLKFERMFFPNSLKNPLAETDREVRSRGVKLPRRAQDRIRRRLIDRQARST